MSSASRCWFPCNPHPPASIPFPCQTWSQRCFEQVRPAAGQRGCCTVGPTGTTWFEWSRCWAVRIWGSTKCISPCVDVQSVPRFEQFGLRQSPGNRHQEKHLWSLDYVGSPCSATKPSAGLGTGCWAPLKESCAEYRSDPTSTHKTPRILVPAVVKQGIVEGCIELVIREPIPGHCRIFHSLIFLN